MKKIKILYTIPNFDTAGSGKVVYDLVKGIDKTIFLPEILVQHQKGDFFKVVKKLGVPIHVFPYEVPYKPFITFPFRLLKVIRFFKSHDWDVIHSWHWSSNFSEVLAAKFAGVKYIYTKKAMGWGNKAWKWKSVWSTQVIAINETMMSKFFNKPTKINASFLPLGLDTEIYQPVDKNIDLQNFYKLKETDFVVISVVNMVPVKGIEILMEAVIQSKIKNIKLLIVGDDTSDYAKKLKADYTKENPQIIFTGKQLDVRSLLSLADVFVISTKKRGEGMPMAPVEAMAMGIPVLGSKVPGVIDVLKGFEEQIFETENVDALRVLLLHFYNLDPNIRKQLGKRMREKVLQEYNFQKFISSREKLYQRIVLKNSEKKQ